MKMIAVCVTCIVLSGCASTGGLPVSVDSTPRGAHVGVDGVAVGKTPTQINLECKKHWVGVFNSPDGWAYDSSANVGRFTYLLLGVPALPPDSKALVDLLRADPSPDVRAAAAARCSDAAALFAALKGEPEPSVRAAVVASLGGVLAMTADTDIVRTVLEAPECSDQVRAEIALHTQDEERRRAAIEGIGDEEALVRVALDAEHASVRIAAAERVHAAEPLRRLLKGAMDKDRGVARLARERLDAIHQRIEHASAADAILSEAEALVTQPGPIVMAGVELNRRWDALALASPIGRGIKGEGN